MFSIWGILSEMDAIYGKPYNGVLLLLFQKYLQHVLNFHFNF